MDAIDAIQRRASVRRFRSDPVPRDIIERLLDCAVRAPNHKLTQPWRFAVLTGVGAARFAEIRAEHRLERYPDRDSAEALAAADKVRREALETPAFVAVMCAVNPDEITREEDYAATMMATANLMIAAGALGLGSYIRTGGIMRKTALAELVGLEPGFRIVAVVSLGYPAEAVPPRPRKAASELTRWIGE